MAQTLASGVVIPAPGDRISAAGVQEIRTLGASVNSSLASTQAQTAQADYQSRARDEALGDQIDGMEGMAYIGPWQSGRTYRINDVVAHGGDSWARLTAGSAGEPGHAPEHWGIVARKGDGGGFGELTETDTPGLWEGVDNEIESRLARLEVGTDWRILPPRAGVGGAIHVKRTVTKVSLRLIDVEVPPGIGSVFIASLLPAGFRHDGEHWFLASSRSSGATSEIGLYNSAAVAWVRLAAGEGSARPTLPINAEYSWDPVDAYPTTVTLLRA